MIRYRILYLVTEDWYFAAHRLPMARAARDAGYDVHVITSVNQHGPAIRNEGFELHPIDWRRGSVNPIDLLRTVSAVRSHYRRIKPDLVHHVGLQASVVGSMAAWKLAVAQINSFVGLGFIFSSTDLKAKFLQALLRPVLPHLLGQPLSLVTTENRDDQAILSEMGVRPERYVVFPGSGVDTEKLGVLPEPMGEFTIAFAGRMIEDKGLRTLIAAHDLLAERGRPVQLLLAGAPDPANPSSISTRELEIWQKRPGIRWLGHVTDISTVWAAAHIAVLPSRREGLPISLLEAASCGRPLVATDVPGCREIARHDVNALLTPAEDASALADAIARLADAAELRSQFGAAGRRIVQEEFSNERVSREIVALYEAIMADPRIRGLRAGARCSGTSIDPQSVGPNQLPTRAQSRSLGR